MAGRIKLALMIMFIVMLFMVCVFYISEREIHKDYSLRGTFVFETLEEDETCLFI